MGIDNPHRRLESPPWQTRGAQVGGDQRVFLARRQLTDACSYQCRVEPRHLLVNETIVESFLTVACVLFFWRSWGTWSTVLKFAGNSVPPARLSRLGRIRVQFECDCQLFGHSCSRIRSGVGRGPGYAACSSCE